MKIKSLLLGSAVAMAAATGAARAADTVVLAPEPEPMEYVRVCDVYGAGFYYIPGTETCLRIGGYVWLQIGGDSYRTAADTPSYHYGNAVANNWAVSSRARLNIDAREETEYGTLRAYLRYQATWLANGVANDGAASVDQAIIELGGLRLGYTESAWVSSQGAGVAQYGSHSWSGMYYGYQQRQLISYTFTGANGFHGTLSLENDTVAGSATPNFGGRAWVPDFVAVAGINQGWGGVWGKVGIDESINAANFTGVGLELGAQANLTSAATLRVIGFYANSDNQFSAVSPVGTSARWSVLGSFGYEFNPKLSASIGAQYFSNRYAANTNVLLAGTEAWAAEASVVWLPVKNLEVRGEYGYTKARGLNGSHSGWVRFTRSF